MPELPEVETVVRKLRPKILNKTITHITITDAKVVSKKLLSLIPFKITQITRRGKYIFLNTNKSTIMVHLRMTGHFHYLNTPQEINQQNHPSHEYRSALFTFNDKTALTFNEIRRFGRIEPLTKEQYQDLLKRIGPDPFDITPNDFTTKIKSYPKANIKSKLLDQACIAGIGNIYAQEALYHAKILPTKKIQTISKQKLHQLHHELLHLLTQAIKKNGTTVSNFKHLDGKGDFAQYLAVYQKEACPKGHELKSKKIAGRGTWYCSTCQK